MNMNKLDDSAKKILLAQGRKALDAWTEEVDKLDGNVELVKELHQRVKSHLALQIVSCISVK